MTVSTRVDAAKSTSACSAGKPLTTFCHALCTVSHVGKRLVGLDRLLVAGQLFSFCTLMLLVGSFDL